MVMLQLNFPANFISTAPRFEVQWDVADDEGSAGFTVREVYRALRAGQDFYQQRKYQDAIREFKRAQSIAYRLLNPQHPLDLHLADDHIMLPSGKAIEAQFSDASLKLLEAMRKNIPRTSPAAAVIGSPIPDELKPYQRLGFQLEGVPPSVNAKIAQGADMIKDGNEAQAVEVLKEAVALSTASNDAAGRAALAVANLNLSSAQLALNDNAQGLASAIRASELFRSLQDNIGISQALHNQAVALSRQGQSAQAKQVFDQASSTLSAVTTQWSPAAPVAPAGPATAMRATVVPRDFAISAATSSTVATRTPSLPESSAETPLRIATKASTLQLNSLQFIADRNPNTVSLRWPGASGGWAGASLPNPAETAATKESWSIGFQVGNGAATIVWASGMRPSPDTLLSAVCQPRIQATSIAGLAWYPTGLGEAAAYLTHVYAFVLPQSLGDCYNSLGNFERAEQYYLQAAKYTYLNLALEAPALWARLARNIVEWGDNLYRDEKIPEAKTVYSKLIMQDSTPSTSSELFTISALAQPAAEAKALIQNPGSVPSPNPAIAFPVYTVLARWRYLNAGLDFYGTSFTPIFTFEYLQQVARSFCESSIQAEREYINFQVQSEAEAATRRELQGALVMAQADIGVRTEQLKSAEADSETAQKSVDLAQKRAEQAAEDRDAYRTAGYWQYISQSIAAAHGSHEDWYEDEIRRLAADMENGSWSGNPGKLAAAATLLGGQKSYEYQLGHMDRVINEMNAMIPIAQAQLASAQAREEAARLSVQAAETRRDLTADALAAFENEVFTPELWGRMAQAMREIAQDYQYSAIRMAKLMERAYNFETDNNLTVIKSTYPATATEGLLGSEYLMRDIDSFTYHYVVHTRGKTTNIKEVISLANDFPFQFYSLQRTGKVIFETSLLDFDRRNPGFYMQRLTAVELEMVALMPPGGVRGYLRSGTISRYRSEDGSDKTRLHTADTLALSEFTNRGDAFLFRGDPRMHGLFEGHGVSGTWELSLPRRSNNLDYRLITDVRLIFYYTAQFSPALRDFVLARHPSPGEMIHAKSLLPRWDFSESWYTFLKTGKLEMDVTEDYLPRNESNFRSDKVSIQILTRDTVQADNIAVTLTLPGKVPATLLTNAEGVVETQTGNLFEAQMGGNLLGQWLIEIHPPAGSPLLDGDGHLNGSLIDQVIIIMQYTFDWPT